MLGFRVSALRHPALDASRIGGESKNWGSSSGDSRDKEYSNIAYRTLYWDRSFEQIWQTASEYSTLYLLSLNFLYAAGILT